MTNAFPQTLISAADGDRLWVAAEEWPMIEEQMGIGDDDPDVEEWQIVPATEQSPAWEKCGNPIYPKREGCRIYERTQGDGSRIAREFCFKEGSYFPTGDWWYLA